MKHIVFLELNRGVTGVEYLKAAKELNAYITLITFNYDYYKKLSKRMDKPLESYIDDVVITDTHNNITDLENKVRKINDKRKIDALLGQFDLEMSNANYLSQKLGLKYTDYNIINICRNKYKMREFFASHNIEMVKFSKIESIHDFDTARDKIGMPAVVKPVDGQGAENVKLINNDKELKDIIASHQKDLSYFREVKKEPYLIMEEYLKGELVSVEAILDNGRFHPLGITDRHLVNEPFFAAIGGTFPSTHDENTKEKIEKYTSALLSRIGFKNGPVHVELSLTDSGPKIVEINPRLAGSSISKMINVSCQCNIHLEILKMYLDLPSDFDVKPQGHSTYWRIYSEKTGKFIGLGNYEEAVKESESIIDFSIEKEIGSMIEKRAESVMDEIAVITVHSDSKENNMKIIEKAMRKIEVVIE